MIEVRPFATLGAADHGWLKARHHFSFANYYDPRRMGWGKLRVWNDDQIAPQAGFPKHPHRDMEIITYVREGAITHKDSLNNQGRTGAGDVQVMSAGTGILHSEFNNENKETRIFQIWIEPDEKGGQPRWGSKPFPKSDRSGAWTILASGPGGDDDALLIRTDAQVAGITLKANETASWTLREGRKAYLVAATGRMLVGDKRADARDGVAIRDISEIKIKALEDTEIVLVDTI